MNVKTQHMRNSLLMLVLSVSLLTSVTCADVTDTIRRSFNVRPGGTLLVESDMGSITVTSGGSNMVEVVVDRRANTFSESRGQEILDNFIVEFDQDGNNVEVTGNIERDFRNLFGGGNNLNVHYTITVPTEYNVELNTAGGSIEVGDLEGTAFTRTAGGSIRFGNIDGQVSAKTAGGSIELEGSRGDVELKTAGGSVSVGRVIGDTDIETSGGSIYVGECRGTLEARTAGGGITIEGATNYVDARTSGGSVSVSFISQPERGSRLETSAGSIEVIIPENIKLNINARAIGGKIITDLPITVRGELSSGRIQGLLNGGGPELELRTSAGNISISKGRNVL